VKGGLIGKAAQITEEALLISPHLNFIIKRGKKKKKKAGFDIIPDWH